MRPTRVFSSFFLLLAGSAWASSAAAPAKGSDPGLAALARSSAHVAVFRCDGAEAAVDRTRGKMVFTTYALRKMAPVAGYATPESVKIRVVGGRVGAVRVTVPDAPSFVRGQDYLVFLKTKMGGKDLLVGGGVRGVVAARKTAAGGWEVDLRGRMWAPQERVSAASAPVRGWVSLEEFGVRIAAERGAQ